MNCICLGGSFTLASSNNNLRVSMSISEALKTKSRKLLREYNHSLCLIDLTSLRKYCKHMIPILFPTIALFSGLQMHLPLQEVYIM